MNLTALLVFDHDNTPYYTSMNLTALLVLLVITVLIKGVKSGAMKISFS